MSKPKKFIQWTAIITVLCLSTSCVLLRAAGHDAWQLPRDRLNLLTEGWHFGSQTPSTFPRKTFSRVLETRALHTVFVQTESIDVTIIPGENEKVIAEVEASINPGTISEFDDIFTMEFKDGYLAILSQETRAISALKLFTNARLTLKIPATTTMVGIKTITGDADLSTPLLNRLSINSISGDINIGEDARIQSLKIDNTSSGVSFEGRAEEIDLNSVSGDVELRLDSSSAKIKHESISGDLLVEFAKAPDVLVQYSSTSGTANILGEEFPSPFTRRLGNGTVLLDSNNVSGDLKITVKGPNSGP